MLGYLFRRLCLLPLTLLAIVLVNFVIINLAPGDPVSITERNQDGASRRADRAMAFGSDDRYLQFREHYGLTLPILWNAWPSLTIEVIRDQLNTLAHRKDELALKEYDQLRIRFGDQAKYNMPRLVQILEEDTDQKMQELAVRFFVRGGYRQAILGAQLDDEEKRINRDIGQQNAYLEKQLISSVDTSEHRKAKVNNLLNWYAEHKDRLGFEPSPARKTEIFFFETRFSRYLGRVLRLDFGSLRNDPAKKVTTEVAKRFQYSLTLAIFPLVITFVLSLCFGTVMAVWQNRFPDLGLNVLFLVLYATPVFVVAPFLIEKVALNNTFWFTDRPIPTSGFHSVESVYETLTSKQRLIDILSHLCLPLIAILYGSLAVQSRLARTAVLEVMRQDYVRTAKAKGVNPLTVLWKHIGRNASITIVTAIAGSLGVVLGGSLIVETLFEINGFGKFFYDAVINRDYNVIMFSTLSGSFLALLGYLVADIAYTALDPRVTLD